MFKLSLKKPFTIHDVIGCFSSSPKKHHWYQVKFIYRINNREVFHYIQEVGLQEQKTTLNKRQLKKIEKPLHLQNDSIQKVINNGSFDVEIICYLGRFSK